MRIKGRVHFIGILAKVEDDTRLRKVPRGEVRERPLANDRLRSLMKKRYIRIKKTNEGVEREELDRVRGYGEEEVRVPMLQRQRVENKSRGHTGRAGQYLHTEDARAISNGALHSLYISSASLRTSLWRHSSGNKHIYLRE